MFSALFLKIDRSRHEFVDALADFDPVNDWLLSEKSYLTWREWGQLLPGDSEPIALMASPSNFLLRTPEWMGAELEWMGMVMTQRFSNLTNTRWQSTNYRGILGNPRTQRQLDNKLSTFNALLAPDIERIQLVEFEKDYQDSSSPLPYLRFYDDGQIESLVVRSQYHGEQNPIWRFVFPVLVEKIKSYQLKQLELAA